jgi:hypothetical protein
MTLPYWDWTLDFDENLNDTHCPFRDASSSILDEDDIGSSDVDPVSFYVRDGFFNNLKDWTLAFAVGDPAYSSFPPDKRLKRVFDCRNFPLTTGPAQTMNAISSNTLFKDFTVWLEGIPHSFPHLMIGMSMGLMSSPDDPIFFLHHANVDRLYSIWMDCHDYENIPADDITRAQYEALNPSGSGPTQNVPNPLPTVNPITGLIYKVTVDTEIPFSWKYPSNSIVFPEPWPTPRDMWPSVDGYKGYDVRYGPDHLVEFFGEACEDNQKWTLVNYGDSPKRSISNSHPRKDKLTKQVDTFKKEIASGKPCLGVIHDLASEECTEAPKLKICSRLLQWIEMNHLCITAFDTVCEKLSQSYGGGNTEDESKEQSTTTTTQQMDDVSKSTTTTQQMDDVSSSKSITEDESNSLDEQSTTTTSTTSQQIGDVGSSKSIYDLSPKAAVPLWVIISLSVGGFVLLVTIIVLVVIYLRKRRGKYVDDSYRVYNDKMVVDVKKI